MPDSLDLMVGVNYANMAIDLFLSKTFGRLVALNRGIYNSIPISTIMEIGVLVKTRMIAIPISPSGKVTMIMSGRT